MGHNYFKKIQLYIVCWMLFLPFSVTAQKIVYEYDNAGNRITRTIVLARMQAPQKAKQDTTFYKGIMGDKEITLYPNPVKSDLNVRISGYDEKFVGEYVLFDMQGKVILRNKIEASIFQIDMSSCNAGNYIMRIEINNETTTWKIIRK